MKNKKTIIIASIVSAVVIGGVGMVIANNSNNAKKEQSFVNDISSVKRVKLDDKIKEDIKKLNLVLDDYYMQTWSDNKFLSFFSYFSNYDKSEVKIEDIEKAMKYELPKSLSSVNIHFVKPLSLKPYMQDKISDKDLEILTVYSALPVKDGIYISSKFDEGKVISDDEYKKFVLEHSWEHGKIRTPDKQSEEYKNILLAVENKDINLKDGNVKYIACDDKYAIVVISNKYDGGYIKEFALEKKDNKYEIIVDELETVDSKIFINYAYTDFNLDMLPLYEIIKYKDISSDVSSYVKAFKESKDLGENEELTYGARAGNFAYLEFKSGLKMLVYTDNEGISNIYEVDNYKTAISQMTKLEQNPPVFILNFE